MGTSLFFFFFLMNEMKSTNSGVEHPQLHRDAVREVSAWAHMESQDIIIYC